MPEGHVEADVASMKQEVYTDRVGGEDAFRE